MLSENLFAKQLLARSSLQLTTRVTPQQRREATNQAAELRQLVETANAPIFGIDTHGNINEWNAATAAITGFTAEEALGKPLVETFIEPERRVQVEGVLKRALEGDETSNYLLPLRTKKGEFRQLLINASTRRAVGGVVSGVVGVAQDITSLTAVRQKMERRMALVPAMIYEFTATSTDAYTYSYASPACEALFGVTADIMRNEVRSTY